MSVDTDSEKSEQAKKHSWWPSVRKTPVPIPNTVVKTHCGENTWRATSWEDSSLPTSKLNKSENWWISIFAFLIWKQFSLGNHPLSANATFSCLCFGRVIPNTVVKTLSGDILVARVERVFGFCYKELSSFCKSPPHSARNPQYFEGQG